jgi:hypothetical protein
MAGKSAVLVYGPLLTYDQALVFPVIITLQKLSNHLALLIPSSQDQPEKQNRDLDFLREMVPDRWKELYDNRDSLFNLANPDFCGKVIFSNL